MNRRPDPAATRRLERNSFFILLGVLTIALVWVIGPFYGAVFWGAVLALVFEPLYRKLLARFRGRRNLAALATLAIILVIVILPLALVAVSLVQEVTGFYQRVKSGEVDFGHYFGQIVVALPSWASGLMDRLGLVDVAALQAKLAAAITQRGQEFAGRVVDFGSYPLASSSASASPCTCSSSCSATAPPWPATCAPRSRSRPKRRRCCSSASRP